MYEGARELRWVWAGRCLITYLEGDTAFRDDLWDRWVGQVDSAAAGSLMLCTWDAVRPTHQQWRRATRAMRDREQTVALISDARHNMALAKAASWLETDIEAFRWNELAEACRRVGLGGTALMPARARVVALRDAHGRKTADVTLGVPTAPDFSATTEAVFETSTEIRQTLRSLQERLRNRTPVAD